jgi:hypothetical protein
LFVYGYGGAVRLFVRLSYVLSSPSVHPQARKVAKQLKKEKGSVAGYTDEENPFGDTTLSEKFVWSKKLEKQIQDGADVRHFGAQAEALRQDERLVSG